MVKAESGTGGDRFPSATLGAEVLSDVWISQLDKLNFTTPAIEASFRADYFATSLTWMRLNLVIGVIAYAAWSLLDGYILPEGVDLARIVRFGVVCPVMIVALVLSFTALFERLVLPTLTAVSVAGCCGLITLIVTMGINGQNYFPGVVLGTMSFSACPGLRFRTSAILSWIIAAVYLTLAWMGPAGRGWGLSNHAAFLVATNLLAMSAAYSSERQFRSDFLKRKIILEQTESLKNALLEVEARRGEAERASQTDPLSGLFNRRHFFSEATKRPRRASVIILDIDHFKMINDCHGHLMGDKVLCQVAARIRSAIRPQDVACRYGGEEFAILLPDTDLVAAAAVGERLRGEIAGASFGDEGSALQVTASVGIASIDGDESTQFDGLIERADQALYRAKKSGRNRVHLWLPHECESTRIN